MERHKVRGFIYCTMIKTALCSFGMSGEVFHAPLLATNANFELTTILERSKNKSAAKYPAVKIVRSFEEIIQDPNIDLVVVNTPNQLHYSMAEQALRAKKHVVLEKPFTNSVAEGQKLIELAKENSCLLSVFHNKRLEGDFDLIKEHLDSGELGEIKEVIIRYDRYKPEIGPKKWKEDKLEGAGILYDLGSHIIDQALFLFGEPLTFRSDLKIEREHAQVTDAFDILFQYRDFDVKLGASMLIKELGPKVVIKGSKGTFKKYGNDPQEQMLKDGITPYDAEYGLDQTNQWAEINTKGISKRLEVPRGHYQDYYQNIANALKGKSGLMVPAEEALLVIKYIEQMYQSN